MFMSGKNPRAIGKDGVDKIEIEIGLVTIWVVTMWVGKKGRPA